jgi:hypothetical protein
MVPFKPLKPSRNEPAVALPSDPRSHSGSSAAPLLLRLAHRNGFSGDPDGMAVELVRRYARDYPGSPLNLRGINPLYSRGGTDPTAA